MKKLSCVFVMVVVVIGISIFVWSEGVKNRHNDLVRLYEKQTAKIETFHDKMWKTLKSQAKIADKYKKGFNEVYTNIMQGRYSSGSKDGSLMKWIKESNPQFDSKMYEKLMVSVEAQRNGFFAEQDIMQGIVKEANGLVQDFPTRYALSDRKLLKFIPISSSVSKRVMETRMDDELYLD